MALLAVTAIMPRESNSSPPSLEALVKSTPVAASSRVAVDSCCPMCQPGCTHQMALSARGGFKTPVTWSQQELRFGPAGCDSQRHTAAVGHVYALERQLWAHLAVDRDRNAQPLCIDSGARANAVDGNPERPPQVSVRIRAKRQRLSAQRIDVALRKEDGVWQRVEIRPEELEELSDCSAQLSCVARDHCRNRRSRWRDRRHGRRADWWGRQERRRERRGLPRLVGKLRRRPRRARRKHRRRRSSRRPHGWRWWRRLAHGDHDPVLPARLAAHAADN
eukprot:835221-Prymnesium_polylepis.1